MKYSALLLVLVSGLAAQTSGELRGVAKDASGRPVAGAQVTARLDSTGASRQSTTDAEGGFDFPAAPVGVYSIDVEADGYKSYVQRYIGVTLGHVITVNVELERGDSTQVLAAEDPLVEMSSTQIGAVVNSDALVDLPLNARDTYQLLQLQPGVQSQQGYDLYAGSDNPGVVSVNGGRGRANNFNVNGGNANDFFIGVPAVQPAPDSIQEFRVLTNLFDAEQGRNSGSVINVVTKSGTNAFHGNVFEFFRNRVLNTRGFFDADKSKFNQNQFGGTLGGPIIKDKTFFFGSLENRRIRKGIPSDLVIVPTAAERLGDFSAGSPFTGMLNDAALADVLNARPGCARAVAQAGSAAIAAGTPWAAIFPGNHVPVSCFDQTALDLANRFVPLPNSGSILQTASVASEDAIQPTLRLDQILNADQQLSFYYYMDDSKSFQPFSTFQGQGANVEGFGSSFALRYQQFNLSHTWSAGASAVNEMRFAYLREGQLQYGHPERTNLVHNSCATVAESECFSDPANPSLGITPGLGPEREGVPFVQVSGAFAIGNAPRDLPQFGNAFQWSDTVSKVMASHRVKFGADIRRQRFDQTFYYGVNGMYNFTAGGANDLGADNLLPNYFLGLPTTYSQGSAQAEYVRTTAVSLFAQDSWNLRRNVTLNYGLRWELNTPMRDTRNRVQTFRPGQATTTYPCRLSASNPLVDTFGTTACDPGTPGESVFPLGLVVPGDKGIPPGMTATYYKAFAPRIGLAWSPAPESGLLKRLLGGAGKSSIRMGWGVFYNPMEQLVLEQFTAEPPFGGSASFSNPLFNTPFLLQDGAVQANPFNGIMNPPPGQAVDWSQFRPMLLYGEFEPRLRTQYSVSYNFTIQRQLGKDLLLQVGYVGSQGHRLLAIHDLNFGQAQPCLDLQSLSVLTGDSGLACGPYSADNAYTIAAGQIPAGFTLHLPYGPAPSITGPNPNPITLVGLRPHSSPLCNPLTGAGCPPDGIPVFGSIFAEDTIANSNYNSLQVSVEKRALAGLEFQAAYTFGKSIDNASSFEDTINPLNYRLSRSLSLFDARHRLVLSYDWKLPGPGRGRFSRQILNGWTLSGILTLQSGFPVPITSTDDLELMSSYDISTPGEPDLIAPFRRLDPRNPDHLAFDPSVFRQPEDLGRIGTSPRSVCCGPGINNLDLGILKNIMVSEGRSLQFRAEFFNFANHAQFTKVDGNISDGDVHAGGSFGRVLQARNPRLIQFALKLAF